MPTRTNRRSNPIVTTSHHIVCQETSIQLTDQKMKNILSNVYEKARSDAGKPTFTQHYGEFLSVALTLLVAILTCDFKPIGQLSADTIRIIVIVATCISGIMGFVLLLLNSSRKHENITIERDNAINSALADIMSSESNVEDEE